MIIEPKVREFICTTAHPEGCKTNVESQINYIKEQSPIDRPYKNVLIIGCSTGYGLASRIVATYGFSANTLGIMYEKPATNKRCATAGWYNTAAFEEFAHRDNYYAKTINGDAFSKEVKEKTISIIKEELGTIDLIIYSLAAPRRTTEDGTTFTSVLKTTNNTFTNKSLDLKHNTINTASIEPATQEELNATIKVMGGEDWYDWIQALNHANVLSSGCQTIAYSYIGPELTYPVYKDGTIGKAKDHLYETAKKITKDFQNQNYKAIISVNKALVTQASSAIPIVPLYMAILYKVMKKRNLHENCIMQIDRLFREKLTPNEFITDSLGRIRIDDYEMLPEVQDEITQTWEKITSETLSDYADLEGYWDDFYHMFGFRYPTVDYSKDYPLAYPIPSLLE